jgi:hypothetical protein
VPSPRWSTAVAPDPFLSRVGERPLDEDDVLLLLLLPLVRVAWADGAVERRERRVIEAVARREEFFAGDTREVLERWLQVRPTDAEFGRGFAALRDFLRRREQADAWHAGMRRELMDLCAEVARARNTGSPVPEVSVAEADSLRLVQAVLWMGRSATWEELDAWLDGQVLEQGLMPVAPKDEAVELPGGAAAP